jgi:hypothetical protein
MERVLHLLWEGPFGLKDLPKLNDGQSDFGVYQIYAHHPVYGRCLVYIGKAREQTFYTRIKQEYWGIGSENDPNRVEVYVGRLIGTTPLLSVWRKEIDTAEVLLIHSHGPAYNSQNVLKSPAPWTGIVTDPLPADAAGDRRGAVAIGQLVVFQLGRVSV